MDVTKSTVKKQTEIEDGMPTEFIDVRLQIMIEPGDKYEDLKAELMRQLDRRFNMMFYYELSGMKERLKEGEHWKQLDLFSDPVAKAVNFMREHNATISAPDDDQPPY